MYLRYQLFDDQRDAMILVARIMILILYGYFGFTYVTDHGSFVGYLKSVNAPFPEFTAIVATIIEFFGGLALLFGFWTRPIAAIFVLYTLGTPSAPGSSDMRSGTAPIRPIITRCLCTSSRT